jgi:hypothetical protein
MVLKSINCLLVDGTTTKIDIGFYIQFKKFNWRCDKDGYVITCSMKNRITKRLKLHHYVLNFKYDSKIDLVVDHKYGNKKDNRLKKVRIVSNRINSLNRKDCGTDTGFPNIYCYGHKNFYRVRYIDINKFPVSRNFPYIEGENEEDIFLQAFEFFENIKQSIPHYREAFLLDDDVSSSGESIDEIDYEYRINNVLCTFNTSGYENLKDRVEHNSWIVNYYDKEGIKRQKSFPYKPKSKDTKDEARTKALLFQKQYDQYHPKKKKKSWRIIQIIVIKIKKSIY